MLAGRRPRHVEVEKEKYADEIQARAGAHLGARQASRLGGNVRMNRPDLEPFAKGGWFMTSDIGYLSADGHLFVLDRLVDIGYRNGIVISPSELERQL